MHKFLPKIRNYNRYTDKFFCDVTMMLLRSQSIYIYIFTLSVLSVLKVTRTATT